MPLSSGSQEVKFISGSSVYSMLVVLNKATHSYYVLAHRWASTSILMSVISDIRHQHLLFRYRRQLCQTENIHSDIESVPISTSMPLPISDIEKKIITSRGLEPGPLPEEGERYTSQLQCCIPAFSVRYRSFWYQAQSDIADHGYQTKCSPMCTVNVQ